MDFGMLLLNPQTGTNPPPQRHQSSSPKNPHLGSWSAGESGLRAGSLQNFARTSLPMPLVWTEAAAAAAAVAAAAAMVVMVAAVVAEVTHT